MTAFWLLVGASLMSWVAQSLKGLCEAVMRSTFDSWCYVAAALAGAAAIITSAGSALLFIKALEVMLMEAP